MSTLGALLGLLVATGGWFALAGSPPVRRPRLDDRLAPYLRDTPLPSALLADPAAARGVVSALLGPLLVGAARRVDQWVGGAASLRARLVRAGQPLTPLEFRVQQVALAAGACVASAALLLWGALAGRVAPGGALVLPGLLAVAAALLRDRVLTWQVRRREAAVLAEFPDVAERIALAVTAGAGPLRALDLVARRPAGVLGGELATVLADTRAGVPLARALDGLAARTGTAPVARFVDGLVVAVERGTPLADLLRVQAADAREAARRALLESAGRREIAMLVPVVFLVLPVTVVFALFPGFYGLRLLAP